MRFSPASRTSSGGASEHTRSSAGRKCVWACSAIVCVLARTDPQATVAQTVLASKVLVDTRRCLMAKSLTSQLYKAARISASGRAARKGYAGRRAKNVVVGKALGRAGVWRKLWK